MTVLHLLACIPLDEVVRFNHRTAHWWLPRFVCFNLCILLLVKGAVNICWFQTVLTSYLHEVIKTFKECLGQKQCLLFLSPYPYHNESTSKTQRGPTDELHPLIKSSETAYHLTRLPCLMIYDKFQSVYTATSKIDSQILLASASSNVLLRRGSVKAFHACLLANNVFPSDP